MKSPVGGNVNSRRASSSVDNFSRPPCQICSGPLQGASFVARLCDVLSWPRFSGLTDDGSGQWQYQKTAPATYVRDERSEGSVDESKACLVTSTGVLCYSQSGEDNVESFRRFKWAMNQLEPHSSAMPNLNFSDSELPCSFAFPVCMSCTRLVRNYVSHRNVNHPHDKHPGYDALYEGLTRRLLSLSSHKEYLSAYYIGETDDKVSLLGKLVIVQATPATKPFYKYEVPAWSQAYPLNQVPSLPRWLMSKLKRKENTEDQDKGHIRLEATADVSPELQLLRKSNSLNRMCSLPVEILRLISTSLDRQSLFALRMTATVLANRLPLDQEFWYRQITHTEMPLLGFEPLTADAHTHIDGRPGALAQTHAQTDISPLSSSSQSRLGGLFGRIDAFGEFTSQFKAQQIVKRGPLSPDSRTALPAKRDWRQYDWKGFAHVMAKVDNFMDGGVCEDAPEGFRARRWRWGQLDKIFGELKK